MSDMLPRRIQRRRTKSWRAPEGAVDVGRGTKWGNPWSVIDNIVKDAGHDRLIHFENHDEALHHAVSFYAEAIPNGWEGVPTLEEIRAELAGHDLMCWCPLVDAQGKRVPCHADVLLEIANRKEDQ